MNNFKYVRPECLEEGLQLLSEYGGEAKCMAGGQSLLLLMREGLVQPSVIVDLTALPGLDEINFDQGTQVNIGALATHRKVEKSALISDHFPVIPQAYRYSANPQVRNMGTIGGNLAHNAPGSDPPPILIALDASGVIHNQAGTRTEKLLDFGVSYYETTLAEDEILTEIQIPMMGDNESIAYQKFSLRKTDVAIVGVAAWIKMDAGKEICENIRVGLSGVHATTVRAHSFEAVVRGEKLNDKLIEAAAQEAEKDVDPISDVHATEAYRREILPKVIRRVVMQAWNLATMNQGY